ncbi:MAG: efflux RND transporter permease subunit, partial [Hyphomicrobiaceae bacterium]
SWLVVRLTRWEERDRTARQIASGLIPSISGLPGARGFPITPAGLGLRGNSSPLRIVVSGAEFDSVQTWAKTLLAAAKQNEGLRNAELDYEENEPQLTLSIDRERANDLGVSAQTIAGTLRTMLASREVTRFVHRGREYPVILQAHPEDRTSPDAIDGIFVRAGDGRTLVPLSTLVSKTEGAASSSLRRFARMPSIRLTAALADNYPLGRAIEDMETAAREVLPPQARLSLDGQSREFRDSSSGVLIVVGLALLIVFLVLAAQFESFVHPAVILLSVPLAIAGALYALWFGGLSINVFSQIGILLLIGLMAKNGILIVEFANQLRATGLDARTAVHRASVIRLRAIVMTVLSTVFGAIPLVLATGAGAESRIAIGTVIMGGLILSSVLTLFLTPVLYALLAPLGHSRRNIAQTLEDEQTDTEALPGI